MPSSTCPSARPLFLLCVWLLTCAATLADDSAVRKIVLIAGDPDGHPANTHEYAKSVAILKQCLETSPNAKKFVVEAPTGGWPKDEDTLDTADTIVLITSGSDRVETNHPLLVGDRMLNVEKQMNRGCGLMTFHYSTFAPNKIGQRILEWTGGYFDYQSGPAANGWYSKIQFWEADAKPATANHPISRGVKPFRVNEEFYYNIRFLENDPRLTPILSVRPPGEEKDHTVGWAVERKNGGRGFGFTGGHPFENWKNEDFRKLILNAICWTAHVEVPQGGVQSQIEESGVRSRESEVRLPVIIVTGHQYPGHPWRETTLALEESFREDPRLAVTSVPDVEFLAKPDLHQYKAVVLNYCNWEQPGLSDAAKANFTKYLQDGGGLVIVHFTNGAWHYSLPNTPDSDWPEWRTKICRRVWDHDGARHPGDKKSQHDAYGPLRVEIAKRDHPITQGMEPFETTDELYFDQQGTEPIEVLTTARSKISGQDAPMAFVYEYGKGRVFQTVLGHDASALRTAGTSQLVRRGTLWAAGAGVPPLGGPQQSPEGGTPTSPDGKFGRALDARRGGLVVKPNAAYHKPPFTVECWASVEPGGFNILVAQSAKESNKHWELFTWHDNGTLTAYVPGCSPDHARSDAVVTDGKWHYLAMTFDGQIVKLFADGKQVSETAVKCHDGRGSTGPLWIGAYPPGSIGCNGLIDEVRISKILREIKDVPNEPFAADEHTIGLWRFDDKTNARVPDESPGKADAVSLSAANSAKQGDDHFFGWQETEGHDDRWQKTDTGRFFSGTIRNKDQVTARALCVRVGDNRQAAVMYDTQQMRVAAAWTGKFLNFDPGRFGLIGMPSVAGQLLEIGTTQWLADDNPQTPSYHGLYLHGDRVVLSYYVGKVQVLESPWFDASNNGGALTRTFEIAPHPGHLTFKLGENKIFSLPPTDQIVRVKRKFLGGDKFAVVDESEDLSALTLSGTPRWTETIVTQGNLGETDAAYVVDTLTLPFENPYNALLFTSGFDFFANGDAAVCTAHGDVWLVRGIDNQLKRLQWKRFATGLYQPLGLKIVNGKVYVLGRDQLTRLHDNNDDGEADFYENFNSDSPTSPGGHDYSTCLETDNAGNFYFLHAVDGLVKISRDGKQREIVATGFRNPNGLGISPEGLLTVSPQEGNWTPASSIIAVKPGGYYGFGGPKATPERPLGYDPPMVWLPRPLDNSSGGQVWATSDKFGPLSNQLLQLSYGRSSMLLVLRDDVDGVSQGAVTTLPLQFDSGVMRGRVRPQDGQVYVVGQQGWVSNAVKDGCFQRVRYTGTVAPLPVGIKHHEDGIAITFSCQLDKPSAEDVGNYSIEQWNYRYAADYGSPDYKVSAASEPGHDELEIRAAKLLDGGTTVFLAVNNSQPVMQWQLTGSLLTFDRRPVELNLAGTIHNLHSRRFERPLVAEQHGWKLPSEKTMRLQPGLLAEYCSRSAGRGAEQSIVIDAKVIRLAALAVGATERSRPWSSEPWKTVELSGFVRAPVNGVYRISVGNAAPVSIEINGRAFALSASTAQPVPLKKGYNQIQIQWDVATTGDREFSLNWSSDKFSVEPIPPTALFHDPQAPSLGRFQNLHRGRALFAERMCVRCHAPTQLPKGAMPELSRSGPSLVGVGSRLNEKWLPHDHQPDLPWFFDGSDADVKSAADIAAYLKTLTADRELTIPITNDEAIAEGDEKFERLGCIACHTAGSYDVPDIYDRLPLNHVAAKYKPGALRAYLLAPHDGYEWNRMPDFHLSDREATALAAYLVKRATMEIFGEVAATGDAERGKQVFRQRCIQCHATGESPSATTSLPAFGTPGDRGCLAKNPQARGKSPDYALAEADREALLAFLSTDSNALSGDATVDASARLMKQFRCKACHSRDGTNSDFAEMLFDGGTSGLPPDRVPDLTWAGEKLRGDFVEQLLAGKVEHRARSWFDARMPAFPVAAEAIAHGMAAEHGLPVDDPPFSPDSKLVEIGKRLSEKNGGLDCRQCHNLETITPKQPNDAQSISFLHVPERIRRTYYDRWMRDPLRIDPATKMPKFAADGQHTVVKNVFDGNAEKQFEALWHYLQSIPRSSKDGR